MVCLFVRLSFRRFFSLRNVILVLAENQVLIVSENCSPRISNVFGTWKCTVRSAQHVLAKCQPLLVMQFTCEQLHAVLNDT